MLFFELPKASYVITIYNTNTSGSKGRILNNFFSANTTKEKFLGFDSNLVAGLYFRRLETIV